jgi:ribosomal-protein-alanine N-acetyltransferase
MEFEIIETERLLLRKFTPETYAYLFNNYPEQDIRRELGAETDEAYFKEKQKYEGGYTTYRLSILRFQLVDKSSGQIIGSCGYHNWFADHWRAELGYELTNDAFKRKGLMTEAIKEVIPYGFNIMNLNRIEAFVFPHNIPSVKLVENNGFIREGLLHQHFYYNGVMEDSIVFGLLRESWEK